MLYGKTVGLSKYKVIRILDLPNDVQDELGESCPGNDTARILNPAYHPLLKQWLIGNGHSGTDCYIGWWSW